MLCCLELEVINMSKKASERVNLMKENFMRLHEEGKTIKEIANDFGITDRAVYLNLQSIADANYRFAN